METTLLRAGEVPDLSPNEILEHSQRAISDARALLLRGAISPQMMWAGLLHVFVTPDMAWSLVGLAMEARSALQSWTEISESESTLRLRTLLRISAVGVTLSYQCLILAYQAWLLARKLQ